MRPLRHSAPCLAAVIAVLLAACGSDESSGGESSGPTIVVTTSVLGDVVSELVGEQAEVVTIMGPGTDPHVFQASAREVNEMREGDALILNGAGHESGMLDVIEAAEADGVPTYEAISGVSATIGFGAHDDEAHVEHQHDDEVHDDGEGPFEDAGEDLHGTDPHAHEDESADGLDGHQHGDADPHFYLDPARLAESLSGLTAFLAETVDGLDVDALDEASAAYVAELEALDAGSDEVLAALADDRRKLVTNHDSLSYFADRYGFEVIGTVIPSGLSTGDGTSAADLAALAGLVEAEGVPAVFADASASDSVARALADEVGHDVEVVPLYTGSLGDADSGAATYIAMMQLNVERIADALS